jgi:hypothetical protein
MPIIAFIDEICKGMRPFNTIFQTDHTEGFTGMVTSKKYPHLFLYACPESITFGRGPGIIPKRRWRCQDAIYTGST